VRLPSGDRSRHRGAGRCDPGNRPKRAAGGYRSTQVATGIADVNRGAGHSGAASSQVLSSAQLLSSENKRLKAEAVKFLGTVRAA
jgi:hypothetical protein